MSTAGDGLSFDDLVEQASGHAPYPYQRRIAEEGQPSLLKVPTGAGKTMAVVLPWLYRRRFHPDLTIRETTPRWLVFTLPMRVLVEQTIEAVGGWLDNLDLTDDVGLHTMMGGEGVRDSRWRLEPERDAIFVGTLDMLLSRALNRGYGASRWTWPIDFGVLNADCHWVFDEVQLMGPALPTSRQLEGLRQKLGTASRCSSTWMSATVDEAELMTVDRPEIGSVIELADSDRTGPLGRRLGATKTVTRIEVGEGKDYERSIASAVSDRHRPGTLSIVVVNTVARAAKVYQELDGLTGAQVVLVHSRFRPRERAAQLAQATAVVDVEGPGVIVVSTQVLEAGVDLSASVLFTESAPWPSVVQRAGRCNRDGSATDAILLWAPPPRSAPYEDADVASATKELDALEGSTVTSRELGARSVAVERVVHPVLRRRDLVELFDTTPDLSGSDVDVSRFIRVADDLDVQVAWRDLGRGGPDATTEPPTRDERCPAPVAEMRQFVKERQAWRYDHIDEAWVFCRPMDVRPGQVLIAPTSAGGYRAEVGWSRTSRQPVEPVKSDQPLSLTECDAATGDDPITFQHQWLSLQRHLADVEQEIRLLAGAFALDGLAEQHIEAAAVAGRLHDIGKAHPAFQDMLEASIGGRPEAEAAKAEPRPWAKSGGSRWSRNTRRHFRHELASALALLDAGSSVLNEEAEPDLIRYLVASHHGRVRLGFRSLPDERVPEGFGEGTSVALGVVNGEELPEVVVPGGVVPESMLDLSVMGLGSSADGAPSWSARMLALRDREDLGPFRLGFLEALVRLADWRASAAADQRDPSE